MKTIYTFSLHFFLFLFVLSIQVLSAQTLVVTETDDPAPDGCESGSDCSLREAIIAANDIGSGTVTIQLMGDQTYMLSRVNSNTDTDFNAPDETSGSLKILNPNATVRIEAIGSGMATISANDIDRVFLIFFETNVVLSDLMMTGGKAVSGGGGGLYVINNSDLKITNSTVSGNSAGDGNSRGGGMTIEGGTVTITGSTISNNQSGFMGGGIRLRDYDDDINEVSIDSDLTIQNSIITNNDGGQWSGGIHIDDSEVSIIESTISENQADSFGGGIQVNGGNVTITRSAIINNYAQDQDDQNRGGFGGGMNIDGGDVLILNSTISGNEAGNGVNSGTTGGIYMGNFSDAVVDILNSTITNNSAWDIGGIYAGNGSIYVANSIIADQSTGDNCSLRPDASVNSFGNNLMSDDSCDFATIGIGGDLNNIDPLLGPLQDNGGPVFTHAPSINPVSPAINNGNNSTYTSGGGDPTNDTDANGNLRVFDYGNGGRIDIGAVEIQQNVTVVGCPVTSEDNILFVKKGETGSGANWFDAIGELRNALALFENGTCTSEEVEEIWVTAGTYLPTDDSGDREATFLMPGVNIYGGFEGVETNKNQRDLESNVSILSGDIDGNDNVDNFENHTSNSYHVITSMGESSAFLHDFTITGGNANGSEPHNRGGGLYASNGGISVNNVLFENNYAVTAGGGAWVIETEIRIGAQHPAFARTTFRNNESGAIGGGLALRDAKSRITSVTFEKNRAGLWGGGLYAHASDAVLKNIMFLDNSADSEGGGVFIEISSPELINVLITGNDAENGGGLANAVQSAPKLKNVTISNNQTVSGNGGGMYNRDEATPTLLNSIVSGNRAVGAGNEIWNSSDSSIEIDYSLYNSGPDDVVDGNGLTATNSISTDPFFEDASTGNYALSEFSPAINAGDPDTELSDFRVLSSTAIDLAENPRVFNGETDIIDMGAYEFQGEPSSGEPVFAPFITTWKTDNPGITNDLSIRIPMVGNGYDFTVDWGDGMEDTYVANPGEGETHFLQHSYATEGIYEVKITGSFPRIYFNNGGSLFVPNTLGDHQKIVSIEQWGDIQWSSMEEAFEGASNLTYNATDTPDLSNVTSLERMFQGAKSFNGDIGAWDVSNITSMRTMFLGADSFNQDLSLWDMSSVTDISLMFDNAASFNQDISPWDVSNVTQMSATFYKATSFNQDLGDWDISNVVDMEEMFDLAGLSTENNDATLIGWAAQDVQNGMELGASELFYCQGESARQSLIDDHNWEFKGDTIANDCASTNVDVTDQRAISFSLNQNYPNPFNPSTLISFDLPESGQVQLVIYDLMGRTVQTLVNGSMSAGSHDVTFDASQLSSGVYLYRLDAPGFSSTRKMMLVK